MSTLDGIFRPAQQPICVRPEKKPSPPDVFRGSRGSRGPANRASKRETGEKRAEKTAAIRPLVPNIEHRV